MMPNNHNNDPRFQVRDYSTVLKSFSVIMLQKLRTGLAQQIELSQYTLVQRLVLGNYVSLEISVSFQ